MQSGQTPTFIWRKNNANYSRIVDGKIIELSQENGKIKTNSKKFVNAMLREQDDYDSIHSSISTDAFMKKAIKDFQGLRITKNDEWETILSFICSQNSNIPKIKGSVQALMKKFGEKTEELYSFPEIESIARAKESDLTKCALGYRVPYLKRTAQKLLEEDFYFKEKIEAKPFLLSCHGIGEKVAECISLFGYGFIDSFPVDVWIQRGMETIYFNKKQASTKQIWEKADELWKENKGYAHEYLFYEFMSKKRKN